MNKRYSVVCCILVTSTMPTPTLNVPRNTKQSRFTHTTKAKNYTKMVTAVSAVIASAIGVKYAYGFYCTAANNAPIRRPSFNNEPNDNRNPGAPLESGTDSDEETPAEQQLDTTSAADVIDDAAPNTSEEQPPLPNATTNNAVSDTANLDTTNKEPVATRPEPTHKPYRNTLTQEDRDAAHARLRPWRTTNPTPSPHTPIPLWQDPWFKRRPPEQHPTTPAQPSEQQPSSPTVVLPPSQLPRRKNFQQLPLQQALPLVRTVIDNAPVSFPVYALRLLTKHPFPRPPLT